MATEFVAVTGLKLLLGTQRTRLSACWRGRDRNTPTDVLLLQPAEPWRPPNSPPVRSTSISRSSSFAWMETCRSVRRELVRPPRKLLASIHTNLQEPPAFNTCRRCRRFGFGVRRTFNRHGRSCRRSHVAAVSTGSICTQANCCLLAGSLGATCRAPQSRWTTPASSPSPRQRQRQQHTRGRRPGLKETLQPGGDPITAAGQGPPGGVQLRLCTWASGKGRSRPRVGRRQVLWLLTV